MMMMASSNSHAFILMGKERQRSEEKKITGSPACVCLERGEEMAQGRREHEREN